MCLNISLDTLTKLRTKMGLPRRDFSFVEEKTIILKGSDDEHGIDCTLSDLDIDNQILLYKGIPVLLYLKYRKKNILSSRESKFHLTKCERLQKRIKDKQDYNYIAIRNTSNKFSIFYEDTNESESMSIKPCVNCLGEIKYKGFSYHWNYKKDIIYKNFSVDEYLNWCKLRLSNSKKTRVDDKYQSNDLQRNSQPFQYPLGWYVLSKLIKKLDSYICQQCNIDFSTVKKFLTVHHVDRNTYNNSRNNLKTLCICCHAEEPGSGHEKLKSEQSYQDCKKYLKN